MANENKIPEIIKSSLENIRSMVDANTIIGDPINCADGTVIVPVSKVGFGFASGGSDFATKAHQHPNSPDRNLCFGGGSGAGITINPIAFLVVSPKNGVSLLPIDQPSFSTFDKIIDGVPGLIEKIKDLVGKKSDNAVAETEE